MKLNPVETKLIEALDRKAEEKKKETINEDDDRLFLLSLLPSSLKSIPQHLKLNATMDIMQSVNKYLFRSAPATCSAYPAYHEPVRSSTYYLPSSNLQSQSLLEMQPPNQENQSPNTSERLATLFTKKSTGNSQTNLALHNQYRLI